MKDLKKAEVVMGRPQKEDMKTWSDIEKTWNTAGADAAHLRSSGAPAEGNARFGVANDEDDDDDDDDDVVVGKGGSGGEGSGNGGGGNGGNAAAANGEVKLRRDVNLRQNMRLELGKTGKCEEEEKKKK